MKGRVVLVLASVVAFVVVAAWPGSKDSGELGSVRAEGDADATEGAAPQAVGPARRRDDHDRTGPPDRRQLARLQTALERVEAQRATIAERGGSAATLAALDDHAHRLERQIAGLEDATE